MFARKRRKKWPIVLAAVLAALVLLGVGIWLFARELSLVLQVNGDKSVVQEYGGVYTEVGARAVLKIPLFDDLIIDTPITVEHAVDPNTVGHYPVSYHAKFLWMEADVGRSVFITDTAPPMITLVQNSNSYTLPGHDYVEEGFSAFDDYDGDLTAKVTRSVSGDIVTYTVMDSSGNTATVQRTIRFDDPVPPELTLAGEKEVVVYLGRAYNEPGFTAIDNLDGDITASVQVSGTVDTHTVGTYNIDYSVTDAYGNTTLLTRTVCVQPVPPSEIVVPEGAVVYLTFDDGPSAYTPRLLEILRKYNVKATFFVVNTGNVDIIRDIVADGHAIGVHSTTHSYRDIYASDEAFFRDFETMHNIIYEKTGVQTTLMRFPGGSSNTVSATYCQGIMTRLAQKVTDYGLQYFDWNVNSLDAGGVQTADEVFYHVSRGIANHRYSVVLQHDIYGYSVDAVEKIIQWGLEKGVTFLPLDPTSPTCHQRIAN